MNNFKGIPKLKIEDGNKNIILLIIITYNKSEELSQVKALPIFVRVFKHRGVFAIYSSYLFQLFFKT